LKKVPQETLESVAKLLSNTTPSDSEDCKSVLFVCEDLYIIIALLLGLTINVITPSSIKSGAKLPVVAVRTHKL
jgi:hypothetical protein